MAGEGVEVFVFKDGKFLGSRCYSKTTIAIGSGRDAALRLRHDAIAAQHAIVRVEGRSVMIANLGSSRGSVLVNGKPVSTMQLRSHDEVAIGPFRIKVSLLGQQEDQGFGTGTEPALDAQDIAPPMALVAEDGEEDAATLVRSMGQPLTADSTPEATLPRIDRASGRDQRHKHNIDRETRPERPQRRAKPPTDATARAINAVGPDDPPAPQEAPLHDDGLVHDNGLAFKDTLQADAENFASGDFAPPQTLSSPSGKGASGARQQTLSSPSDKGASSAQSASSPGGLEEQFDAHSGGDAAEEPDDDYVAPSGDATGGDGYWDDDDEEPFVEPFSLLENVVRERFKKPAEVSPFARTEVIRYGDGELLDVTQAGSKGTIRLFPDDYKLIDTLDNGRARLYFHKSFSGTVVRNGKARPLKRLIRKETLLDAKRGVHAIDLREGDYAQILRDDAGYLVRFVRPPLVPKEKLFAGFAINWTWMQIFVGSAAFHFLILVLLGLTSPEADLVVETEAEKFAKVAMKDLKLEKPEPKKEEPKPEPKKEEPKKVKKVKKIKVPKIKRTTKVTAKQVAKIQKKQVSKVLTALQNLKPAGGPGRSSLKQLTNIAAVRTPRGSGAGGYKVSGVISKLKGNAVRLAGSGGGGKGTKVGRQLLAGNNIGKISARAGTGTRVRARVRKAPTRKIRASGGVLSREAIQRVVSRHMHKVQACYERQLITSPGLSGKIVFDWVISPGGSVATARQVSSSMRSAAVATCILREIRKWRFPKPVGGSVNVRYPFVFRVQGF
ncbi:MAG: AgmX/PglI C-terminal domain-containing protein [Deltaproteobacteria bacterium]|nr:AgmX/PglI C-terminal domain-containing protein [Deltaproteobacteria bacterium]